MKKLLIIIIALSLFGCATQYRCTQKYPCLTKDSTSVKYVRFDSLIQADEDQAMFEALLRCDSNGNCLLDSIYKLKNGKKIVISTNIMGIKIPNNILNITATMPKDSFYKAFYQKEIFKILNKTQVIKQPAQAWYIGLRWLLIIVLAIIVALIVYKVVP